MVKLWVSVGTGISRGNLGDILTDGNVGNFCRYRYERLYINESRSYGRVNVHLEEESFENLVELVDKWETEEIIVSSLRIDVVLARALNLSRNRAKTLIKDQKVKINWVEVERPDIDVEEYDILSIRGFGRVKIGAQLGTTRKDNLVLEIGIIDRTHKKI